MIDKDTYTKKRLQLIERKRQSELRLERHNEANDAYKEQGSLILELVKNAYPYYKSQPLRVKRDLLKILLSNFTLEGKVPKPEVRFAFASFVKVLEKRNLVEPEIRKLLTVRAYRCLSRPPE